MNLIEGLLSEMNRVRELIPLYDLPNGAGAFAIAQMKESIVKAEAAIADGDVIAELQCYEELKCYEA